MIEYPTADEYTVAVQQPRAFTVPELAQARFEPDPYFGIPMPATGSSAVVFKAKVAGADQALRFFTRDDASTRERYTALNEHFARHGLAGNVATCRWIDDAVRVNGETWPVVQMEWVEGRTLDQYVEGLVESGDTMALETLAGNWRSLIKVMQTARFAHGDLQHGNVLVDRSGRLRLVDFDCAWITSFAEQGAPTEAGHRNYQHPGRTWGPWMDTFPGLVVYASLLALARDRQPWESLHTGDNLLFERKDFLAPQQTPAWERIARIPDQQLYLVISKLASCCTSDWSADGELERLLAEASPWWIRVGSGSQVAASTAIELAPATIGVLPPPRPINRPSTESAAMPRPVAPSGQWDPDAVVPPLARRPRKLATTGQRWWNEPGPTSGRPRAVASRRRIAIGVGFAVAVGVAAIVVLLASGAGAPEAMTSGVISALIALVALIPLSIDARRPR